jgi:hypothetical protein
VSSFIDHLEAVLGPIAGGVKPGDAAPSVQIVFFERGPIEGARALATLGLSHHTLALGTAGRTVRQELVMLYREQDGPRTLPGVLHQVAMGALEQHRGFLRGEVIGPRGPLVEGATCEALYVAAPVYFPDELHVFQPEVGDPIVVAWLVPITCSEAHFITHHGWEAFEDRLEARDPDLLALDRPGIG